MSIETSIWTLAIAIFATNVTVLWLALRKQDKEDR